MSKARAVAVAEAMKMRPCDWMAPLEAENARLIDVIRTIVLNLERGSPPDAVAAWGKEQMMPAVAPKLETAA